MLNEPQCLSREKLKEYLAGWSDPNQLGMIEAHLAQCDTCEETVLALEADPDTLVAWVQSASSSEDESEGILTGALSRARRIMGNVEFKPTAEDFIHAVSVSSDDEPKATRIGPYELLQRLGRGGMGDVYLAVHSQLGKQVAIKLLPYHPFRNPHFAARFQREVRAAGCLEHRSIVRATDAGQEGGTHYLVMEHVDGLDLSRLVRFNGPLDFSATCEIGRQVALGLSYAHALGIVHRDIKPSNLMLNAAGEVKILDFGLARVGPWSEESAELTTVGQLMGTLDYMAPEQAERADAVDYRADLYSLGATLFRLCTGRAPLAATSDLSPLAKLRLLSSAAPPKLSTLREDAPVEFVRLMSELLSRQPEDRPSCAATVAERLQELAIGSDLKLLLATVQEKQAAFDGAEPPADSVRLLQAENDVNSRIGQNLNGKPLRETVQHGSAVALTTGRSARSSSRSRIRIALSVISLIGILGLTSVSGITLWLEDQKGTLTIESDSKVTVQVRKEGQPVKKLQVEPGATSTRLHAGRYEIVLDQASDAIQVEGSAIELLSKGTAVAKIVQASEKEMNATRVSSANRVMNLPASTDMLTSGDVIELRSYREKEIFTGEYAIQSDATVKLPIVGTILVAGLTVDQLQIELRERLKPYYKEPDVEVFRINTQALPVNPLASNLSVVNPSTNVSALDAIEPTYQGKSLSEWLRVVQFERDLKRVNEAMSALYMLLSLDTSETIREALLQAVKSMAWRDEHVEYAPNNPYRNAFELLHKANPGTFVDTLVAGLSATDNEAYRNRIVRHGIPYKSKFEEMKPVYQWLQTEVLSKPNPSLTEAWVAIANQMHSGPEEDRASLLELLIHSPQLTDEFWLESLFQPTLAGKTFPGQKYEGGLSLFVDEVVNRCLKTLELPESDAKSRILAWASLANALQVWKLDFSEEQRQRFAKAMSQQINYMLNEECIMEEGAIVPASVANFVNPNGWGQQSRGGLGGIPTGPHSRDVWIPTVQALTAAIVEYEWKQVDLSAVTELVDQLAVQWMVSLTSDLGGIVDPWNSPDLLNNIKLVHREVGLADKSGRVRWPLQSHENYYKPITACALLHELFSRVPAFYERGTASILKKAKQAVAEKVFTTFDSDSDGQLNSNEFSKLLETAPDLVPNFSGFEKIDASGDHLVSEQEYIDLRNQLAQHLE